MSLRKLPAVFARGGTSKALLFHRRDLPANRDEWAPIFLAAMGSPDPNGRQLDGMGGGTSSLSKVCVVGPPTRDDADVDYTFAQVGVDRATVDYGANCGNMSAAIGPFAVDERLVEVARDGDVIVRIHNTNTGKLIHSSFQVEGGKARVDGPLRIDGVAGSGAPIRLEFRDLAGRGLGGFFQQDARCRSSIARGLARSARALWMQATLASSWTQRRSASTVQHPRAN